MFDIQEQKRYQPLFMKEHGNAVTLSDVTIKLMGGSN